jgi:hypothetical protein
MDRRDLSAILRTTSFAALLCVSTSACARSPSDDDIQNMQAMAADVGRAVHAYVAENPDAAKLDDVELPTKVGTSQPGLLDPYRDVLLRANSSGIVLVCTVDRKLAYFEDAACTRRIDRPYEKSANPPCEFTLNVEAICPK